MRQRLAALLWPGLPILLIAAIVILNVTMLVYALSDPPVLVDTAPAAAP